MPCPPECNPHHPPAYAKAFSRPVGVQSSPNRRLETKLAADKKFFVAHWGACLKAPDEESKSGLQ
jgi:hypothetical protein